MLNLCVRFVMLALALFAPSVAFLLVFVLPAFSASQQQTIALITFGLGAAWFEALITVGRESS